jgi:hypothetical protein
VARRHGDRRCRQSRPILPQCARQLHWLHCSWSIRHVSESFVNSGPPSLIRFLANSSLSGRNTVLRHCPPRAVPLVLMPTTPHLLRGTTASNPPSTVRTLTGTTRRSRPRRTSPPWRACTGTTPGMSAGTIRVPRWTCRARVGMATGTTATREVEVARITSMGTNGLRRGSRRGWKGSGWVPRHLLPVTTCRQVSATDNSPSPPPSTVHHPSSTTLPLVHPVLCRAALQHHQNPADSADSTGTGGYAPPPGAPPTKRAGGTV